jgi:hypothetical protein
MLLGCGRSGPDSGTCAAGAHAPRGSTFVFVRTPSSGDRVSSGFRVEGCSSTFEANVIWTLRARDGRALATGFTNGGGTEPGPFAFTVAYAIRTAQVGRLEVSQPTVTSEGFPPVRNVVPLVLEP